MRTQPTLPSCAPIRANPAKLGAIGIDGPTARLRAWFGGFQWATEPAIPNRAQHLVHGLSKRLAETEPVEV